MPMLRSKYYNHSNKAAAHPTRRSAAPLAIALGLFALACGASNSQVAKSARRVPVAHIASLPPAERERALAGLPLILEIRKGDVFPVEPLLESRLVALRTEGTWQVEALETFYVLLREEGAPVVSVDGVDFDQRAHNSFGVGFDAKKDQPTKLRVALTWNAPGAGSR
jgi:hypothetical protein